MVRGGLRTPSVVPSTPRRRTTRRRAPLSAIAFHLHLLGLLGDTTHAARLPGMHRPSRYAQRSDGHPTSLWTPMVQPMLSLAQLQLCGGMYHNICCIIDPGLALDRPLDPKLLHADELRSTNAHAGCPAHRLPLARPSLQHSTPLPLRQYHTRLTLTPKPHETAIQLEVLRCKTSATPRLLPSHCPSKSQPRPTAHLKGTAPHLLGTLTNNK